MKAKLLQFLACPVCQADVRLTETGQAEGIEILEGQLECSKCSKKFSIVRGVPRFADLAEIDPDKAAIASSFGFEWLHFTQEDERYGEQLLGWLTPVQPEFFKDKIVLDGGCGKGRHMLTAAGWGVRDVVGVDLSDAVDSAFAATRGVENMHVVQADICQLPLKRVFDYAYSVGVLDHIPGPEIGFKSLASKLKQGGHLSAWVYGAENNGWIINLVNPVREHVTSRMDERLLLQLTKVPTAVLYATTKLLFGPLSKTKFGNSVLSKVFYSDYLVNISKFGFREQHNIVFDHLVAPTAHYVTREQFESWWKTIDAHETIIGWHNKNSWRGFGRTNGFEG